MTAGLVMGFLWKQHGIRAAVKCSAATGELFITTTSGPDGRQYSSIAECIKGETGDSNADQP